MTKKKSLYQLGHMKLGLLVQLQGELYNLR